MNKFIKVKEIKNLLSSLKSFVLFDIWKKEIDAIPFIQKISIKLLRTFSLAFKGYNEDKIKLRASALTFYSVLSVVPIMAMLFGIAKGFGFEERFQILLQENMKGQEEVAQWLINFSSNMLNNVKGGWIFGVGLVFLLWSVLQVLSNIENTFNSIWQVNQGRVFFRKFSDYFSIMLVAPILILLSSSIQFYIVDMANSLSTDTIIISFVHSFLFFLIKLIPYAIIWMLFTFIYMVMPNTKVKFGSALFAGIIAGTIFQLLQWGYIHFQVGVSKYNTIYGSFAALPLFLVWLNWSWLIVLFGAEISFSAQNHHQYEYETDIKRLNLKTRFLISIYILHFIIDNFKKGLSPFTSQEISKQLKIPVRLVRILTYELIECGLLAETVVNNKAKETALLPAKDINILTVFEVKNRISKNGSEFNFINNNEEILKSISGLLQNADKLIEKSQVNKLIKDI
jgi:membrane protein